MIREDEDVALSTYLNPFSPFDDSFEAWWKYDRFVLGLDTCGLLDREACTNDIASDEVNDLYVREAMERIVKRYPSLYRIVRPSDYNNNEPHSVTSS